jgi:hypothetical protein
MVARSRMARAVAPCSPTPLVNVERVLELLDSHERFLTALKDVIQGKIADARRDHLAVVAEDDGSDAS